MRKEILLNGKHIFFLLALLILNSINLTQDFSINKIEPPNWWSGMMHNSIELLVYGKNLDSVKVSSLSNKIKIEKYSTNYSGKYIFVNLELAGNILPGKYRIIFSKNNQKQKLAFPIFQREEKAENHSGFNEKDVIYLITPDRFANGDTTNDKSINGLPNQFNRNNELARHGGDIAGIISHLDYISDLGATTIWINPLLENNMPISYHGYAATDLYKIDARFGTNELYKKLVNEAHKRNLKIIYDHVSNHVGINHPWVKNPPTKTWFHGTPKKHLRAMHDKMAPFDIHSDSVVVRHLREGWFVDGMPDLNQNDEHLANYLIQNLIWWIEYAGIDGIREDTYAYVNQDFYSKMIRELKKEYPNISLVGEVWSGEPEFLAPYLKGNKFGNKNAELNIVTDFAFRDAIVEFLSRGNPNHLYNMFCKDFIYAPENKHLIFIDNHDTVRPLFIANGNVQKVITAFAVLLTSRGIPQILYGDEIGMKGGKSDGKIRSDFPGGWKTDKRNAFSEKGRTEIENKIFHSLQKLISLRKNHSAFSFGKFIHFPPSNNIYFYIRKNKAETILIVINGNNRNVKPNFELAKKYLRNKNVSDLFTGSNVDINSLEIAPYGFRILRIR